MIRTTAIISQLSFVSSSSFLIYCQRSHQILDVINVGVKIIAHSNWVPKSIYARIYFLLTSSISKTAPDCIIWIDNLFNWTIRFFYLSRFSLEHYQKGNTPIFPAF